MGGKVLIVNGPGLGELDEYGDELDERLTLAGLGAECAALCSALGLEFDFRHTDDQDEMFRWISRDSEAFDGIIINPVGYAYAATLAFDLYRSATKLAAHLKKPVIEVHLTNIFSRSTDITRPLHEPVSGIGFICGFGKQGYLLAIRSIRRQLDARAAA